MPMQWISLAALLTLAVWQDCRHRRIPNRLLGPFAALGVALSLGPDGPGLASALGAALLGAAAFAPVYLLGKMGGGDIKLMATTGLLVGFDPMAFLCLAVALSGGVLALVWGWRLRRASVATLAGGQPNPDTARLRMPYALAIAGGVLTLGLDQARPLFAF